MFCPMCRIRSLPQSWPPTLTVVVDTEEEFDWSQPFDRDNTSVDNIGHQPLAQAIFDRCGIVPTYVVDYPVARSPAARAVLAPMLAAGRCQIGTHLHPWVTPPADEEVNERNSYPGNLPPALERAKLAAVTNAVIEGFGHRPTIYKAGRYGLGPSSMAILAELGYQTDLSLVPYTDFSGRHGPDYRHFTADPFLTAEGILVVPLCVGFAGRLARYGTRLHPLLTGPMGKALHAPGIARQLGLLEHIRLTPEGNDANAMVRLTRESIERGQKLFVLSYHSSSLLPGGSPYVRSVAERDAFLDILARYCDFFMRECHGQSKSVGALQAILGDGEMRDRRPEAVN